MRLLATLGITAALLLAVSPSHAQTTYPAPGGPFPIPDNDPTGVTSPLVITDAGSIDDLDMDIQITHTWMGDIVATLTHTDTGTSAALIDRPLFEDTGFGCSGDNADIILDDEATLVVETDCMTGPAGTLAYTDGERYQPNEPLSGFDGEAIAGTWQLNVNDNAAQDTGQLDAWALVATLSGGTASEPGALPAGYAFDLTGANPARTGTQLEVRVAETQDVRVVIFDALGREVGEVFSRTLAPNQAAFVQVNVAQLRAGTYVARASGAEFEATQAFVVTR